MIVPITANAAAVLWSQPPPWFEAFRECAVPLLSASHENLLVVLAFTRRLGRVTRSSCFHRPPIAAANKWDLIFRRAVVLSARVTYLLFGRSAILLKVSGTVRSILYIGFY